MKIVKMYIAAAAITVAEFIMTFSASANFFKWIFKLPPANIWKTMHGAPTTEYYIGTLVLNILFVLAFAILYNGIPGEGIKKGLIYGFLVWLVGILPGMFASYLFMNMAQEAILYLTILGLVMTAVKGVVTALICGKL